MKRPKNIKPVGSHITLLEKITEVHLTLKERAEEYKRYADYPEKEVYQIARRRYEVLKAVYIDLKEVYKSQKAVQSNINFTNKILNNEH